MKNLKTIVCVGAVALALAPCQTMAQTERVRGGDAGAEARQRASQQVSEVAVRAEEVGEGQEQVEAAARGQVPARGEEARQQQDRQPTPRGGPQEAVGGARSDPQASSGQGAAQRQVAMERRDTQFEAIHARRMAQLERIRDLAVENDREEVLTRVEALIEKEQARYARQSRERGGRQ